MKALLILTAWFLLTLSAFGQPEITPQPIYKGDRLLAIHDLYEDESCASVSYKGIITKVGGEYPEMFLNLKDGRRVRTIEFYTGNLSMADNGNLYDYLVKKGKRVLIKTLVCGSGGFLYAKSIIDVSARNPVNDRVAVVITKLANLRKQPSGKILGRLPKGTRLVLKKSGHLNGWYFVSYNKQDGWIHGNLIKIVGAQSKKVNFLHEKI